MKKTNIIQRLSLLLLLFALCGAAHAQWTDFYDSKTYGKKKDVSEKNLEREHSIVRFNNCKTSGAGNIFELVKGTGVTISAKEGYCIREIVLEDTEGGDDYDEGGLNRIGSYSDPSYSMNFVKNSGSQPDNNNIVFYNYDAPARSIRIVGHNMSNKGQLKVRRISVVLVSDGVKYFQTQHHKLYALGNPFNPTIFGYNTATPTYSSSDGSVASYVDGRLTPLRAGHTTIKAFYPASASCSKSEAVAQVTVSRNPVTMEWGNGALPDGALIRTMGKQKHQSIANFDATVELANGKWKFGPAYGNSFTSDNTSVLTAFYNTANDEKRLDFGGTAGKVTITLRQEQTDFYTLAAIGRTYFVMRSDDKGTILIKDPDEYKLFTKLVNEKGMTDLNARLEADINLGSDITMIGTKVYPYAGTLDGQGHTLTIDWSTNRSYIAPIQYTGNANIKNLHTKGQITIDDKNASGLVCSILGTTTISGCISEVNITSTHSKGSSGAAGMVSVNNQKGNLTITDCIVKGKINATTENGRRSMAGFVDSQEGTCTLNSCLFLGSGNGNGTLWAETFANNAQLNRCYYLYPCGKAQGEKVTEEQLRNGDVAHKLQNGRSETVWGQELGKDDKPMLTTDAKKKVYKVEFKHNNNVAATRYANSGKTIIPPTLQEILGSEYNAHHYYAFNLSEDLSSTPINADKTILITLTEHDHFAISSPADWQKFCDLVNGGQNAIDAKLTQDIDLGTELSMVGTNSIKYGGTFDGQGHSITVNWNTNDSKIALFRYINEVTIKNLHTKGSITTSNDIGKISGMVWSAAGHVKLTNCSSMVNLTATGVNAYSAGIIGDTENSSYSELTDCLVGGKFSGSIKYWYGFVQYQGGWCVLNNCLYIGKKPEGTKGDTFVMDGKGVIDNCYYLNAIGEKQGTKVTDEQLKSGYVAHKLQAGRSETVWGQELGKDDNPQLTADTKKRVHRVEFKHNNNVAATRYANSGKTIIPPTLQDILGDKYNAHHYYTFNLSEDLSSTPINADKTILITLTEHDHFVIASTADWQNFCEVVNGGENAIDAKLTEDINLGGNIWMVANGYSGTFDGQGHSITVNWNTDQTEIALFRNINESTIKNLHTKGDITTSNNNGYISGMVWSVAGHVKLTNCSSMVNLTATGNQAHSAGMIGNTINGSYVELTDCLVGGTFSGSIKYWSGFIRYKDGWCILKNCLYIGRNHASALTGSTFFTGGMNQLENCYYLNPCDKAQGEKVTAEQLKSGYVAHKLQAGRSETVWGQELDKDNNPQLTADTKKRVHRVEFRYNDKVWATHYVNNGKTVTPPTVQNIVGSSYDPHHYYAFNLSEDLSSTPINADKTILITLTEKSHFEIGSTADWQKFSEIVNGGQTGVDAKLTEDIYIKDNDIMVGTNENPYRGTFDGQHHSIRISWNTFRKEENGLFAYIDGATILNLHSLGSIITNHTDYHTVSGMVCQARGNVTLTGCSSMVKITQTKHRSSNAGLISNLTANSHATLNDCLVGEDFCEMYHNEGKYNLWCGFVNAHDNASTTLNNCLFIARKVSLSGEVIIDFKDDYTFANGNVTLNNCYFLNALDKEQGKKVTEEQLKSGYVTKLLQAGRTDKCYWEQTLGEMPKLYNPDGIGTNRIWWDTYKQTWYCGDFHISGYMPIGLDFEADDVMFDYNTAPDGLYTISVPFDWWIAGQAYTLASVSGNIAHFQEVTNDENYKANTPYLFKAIYTNSVIYARKSYVKATPETPVTIEKNGVKFTACYAGMSNEEAAAAGAYILQGDKQWHKVTTANTAAVIPPYRAYLTLPATSEAKTLSISFDDETTGISAIETTDLDGTVHYYDLNGRYIGTSLDGQPRGVYVGNGKKVVKK